MHNTKGTFYNMWWLCKKNTSKNTKRKYIKSWENSKENWTGATNISIRYNSVKYKWKIWQFTEIYAFSSKSIWGSALEKRNFANNTSLGDQNSRIWPQLTVYIQSRSLAKFKQKWPFCILHISQHGKFRQLEYGF